MKSSEREHDLNQTMQIPIVNEPARQQEFQSPEERYYPSHNKKTFESENYCAFFNFCIVTC